MILDQTIWGPPFWFFLHTLAISYPHFPNTIVKKKYYELIQNLPLFIPNEQMASHFSKLLDEYPIQPYLDSRDSCSRWMWFIHNKINEKLEKPKITLSQFYEHYYQAYKPKNIQWKEYYKTQSKIIYVVILICLISVIFYLSR